MSYRINPLGEIWENGVFCLPKSVAQRLKFPTEEQLKVLLLVFAEGKADVNQIKASLSMTADAVEQALEYWESEGVLLSDTPQSVPEKKEAAPAKRRFEELPMPTLTDRDIIPMCAENPALTDLLRSADKILAGKLSMSLKSNLVNMVTYYGLPVPVVVTLLEYYQSERNAGKNITTRTLNQLAKEWAEEDVNTLEKASGKLQERSGCEDFWNEVLALCEFEYKKPGAVQMKMISRWLKDYEKSMIYFACNTMKKYNEPEQRSIKIVDNILKDWKRKGFKTPEDVTQQPEKKAQEGGKLKREPSFDIDELKRKAILNDDFDI